MSALCLCRSRLAAALRSALACAFVGAASLYGPAPLRRHVTFPAFSYVVAVLVSGGDAATLGAGLRAAAGALYATALAGVAPAMLVLHLIRPAGLPGPAAALAVGLSALLAVALPASAGLVARRVALGQVVIIYVAAAKHGHVTPPVMHAVNVAVSTAVGVVASVLALLFPYPKLACYEVRGKSRVCREIMAERVRVLVNGFCADNPACMAASVCQAGSMAASCSKLLQNIKAMQGSISWERPPFKFLPPSQRSVTSERLQAIETPLKGLAIALSSTTSLPITSLNQQLIDDLICMKNQITAKLSQDEYSMAKQELMIDTSSLQPSLQATPESLQDLPSLFFLFCMKLLSDAAFATASPSSAQEKKVTPTTDDTAKSRKQEEREELSSIRRRISDRNTSWAVKSWSTKKLIVALKCSLSLGLAVLFGVLFSRDDGYWAGLTVAITFSPRREATFHLANIRAQGTALGSIYGVLASCISQNLMEVRLLVLLPWIVLTSFLQQSKMYGQAGGIAAMLSAMIILGRRNYGSPIIFSIARLTETFIGLCCAVLVELMVQPTRASTLARTKLSRSLTTLHECLDPAASSVESKESAKKLREQVSELRTRIGVAGMEPKLWYSPFPTACYNKLHGSLAKVAELVLFLTQAMELVDQESNDLEFQGRINEDLDQFKELASSSAKCFEEVSKVRSLATLEKEYYLHRKTSSSDVVELEKGQNPCGHNEALSGDEEEWKKVGASFLGHSRQVMVSVDSDVSAEPKNKLVLGLAAAGFCIGGVMKEMREIEKGILELVQSENPSSHINLHEISRKVKELST